MLYLDVAFVRMLSGRLQRFKQTDDYVWNVRCPECGDSERHRRKARGYFFKRGDMIFYHCHNCSDKSKPLPKFLKDNFPDLFEEYKKEQLREKYGDGWADVKQQKENERRREEEERGKQPTVLDSDPNMGTSLDDLPPDHVACKYTASRKLPPFEAYYTEKIKDLACNISERYKERKFKDDPRLIIPHRDTEGKILGVSARALSTDDEALRYIHLRVNDDAFFIYGLNTVDFSRPVIVVEGQFDSLFLDNAIAVSGSAMKKIERLAKSWNLSPNNFVLAWDNDPRNRDVCKLIKRAIRNGYHTAVWERAPFKGKDINEMVLHGADPKDIQHWILNNSRNSSDTDKIRLELRLNQWTKCKI